MIGPIKPTLTIDHTHHKAVARLFIDRPLSGYLAGKERGGHYVCQLEQAWAERFDVKHAIACNSATSGLMAAAFAIGLRPGDEFLVPAMTMSATAAAPMFTGATPVFGDVEDSTFSLRMSSEPLAQRLDGIFLTHLFGLASDEGSWVQHARDNCLRLVVDASQAPLAVCDGVLAGTEADIGVFSLNVHKPLQCGEGGICVTNDDDLAERLRAFINHGENAGAQIGLNLRMPEVCAAIALVQLRRAQHIISAQIEQAQAILTAIGSIPGLRVPRTDPSLRHVYYAIPFLIEENRAEFCHALRNEGVPIVEGYVAPLYRLPAFAKFARPCPVAEDLHDRRLFYFENCAYDPTPHQIEQIGAAFRKAAEKVLWTSQDV